MEAIGDFGVHFHQSTTLGYQLPEFSHVLRGHPYFRGQVCRQEAGEDEDITIVRFATAFGALAACPIPPPLRYPEGGSPSL